MNVKTKPENSLYGKDIKLSAGRLLTEQDLPMIQSFDCGNEVINNYLKEHATQDPQSTTFVMSVIIP